MLLNNFFQILSQDEASGQVKMFLKIDPAHQIFDGHFPGQPIVPGVCMMQMVKECIEKSIDKKIQLKKAVQVKFLAVIEPLKVSEVELNFSCKISEDDTVNVSAEITKDGISYFKLKAVYSRLGFSC